MVDDVRVDPDGHVIGAGRADDRRAARCATRSRHEVESKVRGLRGVADVSRRVRRDDPGAEGRGDAARPLAGPRGRRPDRGLGDHPRPRGRERQGWRRQVVGHREPRGRARGAWAHASACSTPTSGASACRACSASTAASAAPTARSTPTTSTVPNRARRRRRRRARSSRLDGLPRRRRGHRAHVARPDPHQGRSSSSSPTCGGASSTTCSSTCRPGTGDIQMGLARMLPQAEMLVVTTPGARRAEGRGPRRRHGPPLVHEGRRRRGEHERVRRARRRAVRAVRRPAAARRSPQEIGAPLVAQIPLEPAVSRRRRRRPPGRARPTPDSPAGAGVPRARRARRRRAAPADRDGRLHRAHPRARRRETAEPR